MKPVQFHPLAECELEDAAAYYEAQRQGLGREFRLEFEAALARLTTNPLHFTKEIDDFRACMLKRFPYTIFFLDDEPAIWIAALAHQSRKTSYWAHRKTP